MSAVAAGGAPPWARQAKDGPAPEGAVYLSECGAVTVRIGGRVWGLGCPSGGCGKQELLAEGASLEEAQALSRESSGTAVRALARRLAAAAARRAASALRRTRRGDPPPRSLLLAFNGQAVLRMPDGTYWACRDGYAPSGPLTGVTWSPRDAIRQGLRLAALDLTDDQLWRAARNGSGRRALDAVLAPPPEVGARIPGSEEAWRMLPIGTVLRDARPTRPDPACGRIVVADRATLRYVQRGAAGGWAWSSSAEPWYGGSSFRTAGATDAVVEAVGVPLSQPAFSDAIARLEARRERMEADGTPCAPGDVIGSRREVWDLLPPGSVVDTHDGSSCPLAVCGSGGAWGWGEAPRYLSSDAPNWDGGNDRDDMRLSARATATYLGRLPTYPKGRAFFEALADLGYAPAKAALGRSS